MNATSVGLNADFGYVILVTISAIIMSWRAGYQVVSARKKFNVQVGDGLNYKIQPGEGLGVGRCRSMILFSAIKFTLSIIITRTLL